MNFFRTGGVRFRLERKKPRLLEMPKEKAR